MTRKVFGSVVAVVLMLVLASTSSAKTVLAQHDTANADKVPTEAEQQAFAAESQAWRDDIHKKMIDSMKQPSVVMTAPSKGSASALSVGVAPASTGQVNYYTWTVGTGTTTMGGAYYFNNAATYTYGNSFAESYWDYSKNACYSYASTNVLLARADGWCVAGNEFDYKPTAQAGTLVAVNVRAAGTIRGRVANSGSGSSNLLVRLTVFDKTDWTEFPACEIRTWGSPSLGYVDAVADYDKTCSYQLVSGHHYVAYVGVDTSAESSNIAWVWSDASPNGPSSLTDKKVTMTNMVITSN